MAGLEIVTCMNCNIDVYEVVGDIGPGKVISASDFRGVNGFENPKGGEVIVCPSCGDRYLFMQSVAKAAGYQIIL